MRLTLLIIVLSCSACEDMLCMYTGQSHIRLYSKSCICNASYWISFVTPTNGTQFRTCRQREFVLNGTIPCEHCEGWLKRVFVIGNVGLLQGKLGIHAHVFSVGVTFWVVRMLEICILVHIYSSEQVISSNFTLEIFGDEGRLLLYWIIIDDIVTLLQMHILQ